MFTAAVAIEILVVAAIEAAEAFNLIFHRMRMHDIHNHGYAELMGIVDKVLQFVGCAETA